MLNGIMVRGSIVGTWRPQYHPDYYAAFVRDPDGHRIEAVTHVPTEPLILDEG